nr:FtsX-like permease family protein [Propionicimonas sp.]
MELIRLAWSRIRGDGRRSFATVGAVTIAVASFLVLAASTATQQALVTETAQANYRTAYDILVRPRGSALEKERVEGLVRSNYLSGSFGGLTLDQVAAITAIPGVEVAAPIAMVGYTYQRISVSVDTSPWLSSSGRTLLRWTSSVTARNRTATARGPSGYRYQTDRDLFGRDASWTAKGDEKPPAWLDGGLWEVVDGHKSYPCPSLREPAETPFEPAALWDGGVCLSSGHAEDRQRGLATVRVSITYPMLIAAIDPEAEAALVGLDRAVYEGRYLSSEDAFQEGGEVPESDNVYPSSIPVVMAGTQFADYQLRLAVDELSQSTADKLGTIAPDGNQALIERAPSIRTVKEAVFDAAALYAEKVAALPTDLPPSREGISDRDGVVLYTTKVWRPADVTYEPGSPLRPVLSEVDPQLWRATFESTNDGFEEVPMTAQDTSYRSTTAYTLHQSSAGNTSGMSVNFQLVGKFDPTRITEFSGLSAVPLETYITPQLAGADEASRRALGDRPMLSDLNTGGYLQQSPALLMPLKGLGAFTSDGLGVFDPDTYVQVADFDDSAPVSAVRVRVAGVTGMDTASRERIASVAASISAAVDADVDITIGSSPELLQVALPATELGSPALSLSEPWSRKGVTLRIVDAVDAKSLLLFGLILVSSALTVAISAGAAVQTRRQELGILAAIGWTRGRRRLAVLTELAMIGGAAGILGALASWPLSLVAQARFDVLRAALAVPAAVVLTTAAGLAATWRAGRVRPIDALRPPELAGGRRTVPLWGGGSLGLSRILRRPGRLLLGSIAIALAVASLLVLVSLARVFRGRVVGTLLGDAVAVLVRPQDLVAAGFLALLGLVTVGLVLFLNLTQDARMYASLQAIGWRRSWLARSLSVQALVIGAVGSALGLAAGLWIMVWLTESVAGEVAGIAATVVAATLLATQVVVLAPAAALRRIPTARLLAEE